MKIESKVKYLRISPRKIAYLGKFLKNQKPEVAIVRLRIEKSPKKREIFEKLIKNALVAAKERGADEKSLVIKSLTIGSGPAFKRRVLLSRGRADIIKKRTSHIYLTLTDNKTKKRRAKKITKLFKRTGSSKKQESKKQSIKPASFKTGYKNKVKK